MNDDRKNALLMPSIAIVGVLAALLIDIADGPAQKTLGTSLLLLGFIGLWLHRWKGGRVFQAITLIGLVGFIILTVLRVVHAS